jgi:hypothetical protein
VNSKVLEEAADVVVLSADPFAVDVEDSGKSR